MGALSTNRSKRDAEFQSVSCYNHHHIAKKLKSSPYPTKISKSSISRLSFYPQHVTPIDRELHAPCVVVTGFNATLKRFNYTRRKSDFPGEGVENTMFSKFSRAKEPASMFHEERDVVEDDRTDSGSSSIELD